MHKRNRLTLVFSLIFVLSLLPPQVSRASQPSPVTFLTPGEGSAVTSPLELAAIITLEEVSQVRAALVDRNGDEISRQLLNINRADWISYDTFKTLLYFEIPGDTSNALLTLSTFDGAHRPTATRSVILTLKSEGQPAVNNTISQESWLTITRPEPNMRIQDEPIRISGIATPVTDQPIFFELVTEAGRLLGHAQLAVEKPGENLSFDVSINYGAITSQTDVLLIVRQTMRPYGVNAVLDSQPLTLLPKSEVQ